MGKACQSWGPRGRPRIGPTVKRRPESAPEQKALAGEQQGGPARDEKDLRGDEPRGQPLAVRDQPQGSAQEQRDRSHLEMKIQCKPSSHVERKTSSLAMPPSSQQGTAKIRLRAPESAGAPSAQDGPRVSSVASPTQLTYSSSFKRVSPRTVSFRVMSRKDQEDNVFTRSASMRLPANKIEEKLEKYASAVQRSEVKSSLLRNVPPSSEGVASKRSIFEASKADSVPVRKESLRLPGLVTSRINLWISRTEEPSQDGRTKDTGKMDGVPRRGPWAKQHSDASTDTRL
nr:ladinin-1 [Pelodiscus sinensis]|eukprot:XP_006115749.1 ladinin-1 [Pelodiscus sinensis]